MEISNNNNSTNFDGDLNNENPKTYLLDNARRTAYCQFLNNLAISSRPFINLKGSNKFNFTQYPIKWDYPCYKCLDKFDNIPIIRIHRWNNDKDEPIFNLTNVFCSPSCYREYVLYSCDNVQNVELENIAKFCEKYFGIMSLDINFIPIYVRKDINPFGTMTKEEWKEKKEKYYTFIVTPPFYLVDTFIIENDRKNEDINTTFKLNTGVTEEMQRNYEQLLNSI